MYTRRALLLGSGALLAAGTGARAEPIMTDEGYYREPWFIESFLDGAEAGLGVNHGIAL